MFVKVVGKKVLNFTTEDGKVVDGAHYHLTYEEDGVEGLAAEKIFVSSAKLNSAEVSVGDMLEVYYNRYGKVDKIQVADDIDI